MNEINANARLRVAAAEKADAEKIIQVRPTDSIVVESGERTKFGLLSHPTYVVGLDPDPPNPIYYTTHTGMEHPNQVKAAEASAEAKVRLGWGHGHIAMYSLD